MTDGVLVESVEGRQGEKIGEMGLEAVERLGERAR